MRRMSINGISAEYISVLDRGFHYGDGLFETIACTERKLQFWDEHISRIHDGAKALNIESPSSATLLSDISRLISDRQSNHVVKIMLTRGKSDRGYKYPGSQNITRVVFVNDWPDHLDMSKKGARLCFCKHPISINPMLSGIKHLNRLDNILARNEWNDEFHEGLMSDVNGNIIEGTMSNVFGIRNGALYTPSLDQSGVSGVIRKQIIDIAKTLNIPLHISHLSKNDICSMDEVFITNSIIGLWPVSMINDVSFKLGDTTRVFYKELQKLIHIHAKTIT